MSTLSASAAFYPGSVQVQQVILTGGTITVTKMELGTHNNTPYLIAGETSILTLKADWVDDSPKTIDFTPSRNFRNFIFEPIQPEPGGQQHRGAAGPAAPLCCYR